MVFNSITNLFSESSISSNSEDKDEKDKEDLEDSEEDRQEDYDEEKTLSEWLKVREDWLFKTKIEIERTKKIRLKRVLRVAREFEDPEVFATVDERRLKAVIVLLEYQTDIKKTAKKDKKELGKLWLLEFKNPEGLTT